MKQEERATILKQIEITKQFANKQEPMPTIMSLVYWLTIIAMTNDGHFYKIYNDTMIWLKVFNDSDFTEYDAKWINVWMGSNKKSIENNGKGTLPLYVRHWGEKSTTAKIYDVNYANFCAGLFICFAKELIEKKYELELSNTTVMFNENENFIGFLGEKFILEFEINYPKPVDFSKVYHDKFRESFWIITQSIVSEPCLITK